MFLKASSLTKSSLLLNSIRHFRAAILLSGSGVYDGSEITESVSLSISLSKNKASKVDYYSLNKEQFQVVNHLNGEV
jgi:enhancing lycopene biosynthesis protein 2